MGLNWGAGLTAFGKGLKGVQAAKEKTAELEYRNMRDQNLRRFELEDRAHKDTREDAATAAAVEETARKEERADEEKGLGDTERANELRRIATEKEEKKHSQEMEKIAARLKGKKTDGSKLSREDYVAKEMQRYDDAYLENTDLSEPDAEGRPRRMKKGFRDMLIKTIGQDYDAIYGKGTQVVGSPVETDDSPTPFDEEGKPSQEESRAEAERVIGEGADPAKVKEYLEAEGYDTSWMSA